MLRTIRLTAAIVCFTLITLLFLDFTGTLHTWFGWLAKIQFLPAVLALNIGVVLFLIVLTLLFGRIYCSVICPLGVFQDAVSWFSGKQKKNRFRYSPALKWLRYGVLAVFILALVAGLNAFVVLLAPYYFTVFNINARNTVCSSSHDIRIVESYIFECRRYCPVPVLCTRFVT